MKAFVMASKTVRSTTDPGSEIQIDPRLASLIPPLSPDELANLTASLLAEKGCRDPLIVWKGKNVLLDGHNRLGICREHNLKYTVVELELPDLEAAKAFIIENQLSRRNLSPEAASYLRGTRYLGMRHQGVKSGDTSGQSDPKRLSEQLAKEYKVGEKTIRRDAKFAQAVDQIAANCGEDAKKMILGRDTGLSRGAVARLTKLEPKEQQEFLRELSETGKPPRKRRRSGKRTTITLPTRPVEFAKTLLSRISREEAAELAKALAEALAFSEESDEGHRQNEMPAKSKGRRKGQASQG
jgi:hypothetical protein